ncbi:MAG: hypothetical protein HC798_00545 [Polaribacter sp.]|nr:hypothetical protein [Polaribacter sp.]
MNVFENFDRNQIKVRVFFEIVVKAKKDDETNMFEMLFDEKGNHIKTLKFEGYNILNLEF